SYVARLVRYMDKNGYAQVTPRNREPEMPTVPFIEHFSSGYVQRSMDKLPRQGTKAPWRVKQNYFADIMNLRFATKRNEGLEFTKTTRQENTETQSHRGTKKTPQVTV